MHTLINVMGPASLTGYTWRNTQYQKVMQMLPHLICDALVRAVAKKQKHVERKLNVCVIAYSVKTHHKTGCCRLAAKNKMTSLQQQWHRLVSKGNARGLRLSRLLNSINTPDVVWYRTTAEIAKERLELQVSRVQNYTNGSYVYHHPVFSVICSFIKVSRIFH